MDKAKKLMWLKWASDVADTMVEEHGQDLANQGLKNMNLVRELFINAYLEGAVKDVEVAFERP